MLEGERQAVAGTDNLELGVVAEGPGRKGDGGGDGFKVARRQVDDEAPLAACQDLGQRMRERIDVPVIEVLGGGLRPCCGRTAIR